MCRFQSIISPGITGVYLTVRSGGFIKSIHISIAIMGTGNVNGLASGVQVKTIEHVPDQILIILIGYVERNRNRIFGNGFVESSMYSCTTKSGHGS